LLLQEAGQTPGGPREEPSGKHRRWDRLQTLLGREGGASERSRLSDVACMKMSGCMSSLYP
jgi:hypothetical protein